MLNVIAGVAIGGLAGFLTGFNVYVRSRDRKAGKV